MNDAQKPLVLHRRGEDGNKVISLRIREDLLLSLDEISRETKYSRNELINILIEYGIENIEIK